MNKGQYIGDYKLISELGSGKFATVVLAKQEPLDHLYALKIVLKKPGRTNKLKMEAEILELLTTHKHRLIVEYFGSFQTNGHMCFVLEFLEGGTIYSQARFGPLEEDRARFYAACMLSGIAHLHSLNIAHKDIKPQNVVIDYAGYAKLVDFGHSQTQITYATPLRNKLGTRRYKAPEYFEPGPVYRFADFWALCVTLNFMLTGKHLDTKIRLKRKHLSPSAYDLLTKVFVTEPFERLGSSERGAQEIMEHQFFESIDWEKLKDGTLEAPKAKPKSIPIVSPNLIFNEVKSVESFIGLEG